MRSKMEKLNKVKNLKNNQKQAFGIQLNSCTFAPRL